jgi:hypothetical protein
VLAVFVQIQEIVEQIGPGCEQAQGEESFQRVTPGAGVQRPTAQEEGHKNQRVLRPLMQAQAAPKAAKAERGARQGRGDAGHLANFFGQCRRRARVHRPGRTTPCANIGARAVT